MSLSKTTNRRGLFANILGDIPFQKGRERIEESLILDTKVFVLEGFKCCKIGHPRRPSVLERDTTTEENS